jgi:hypothetical protein
MPTPREVVDRLLAKLNGVKPSGDHKWQALCPAHADDKTPSLSITLTDKKVLLHCFAGCTFEAICTALDVTSAELSCREHKGGGGALGGGRRRVSKLLPTGQYLVLVREVRSSEPKDGVERWGLKLFVACGEYRGESFWSNLWFADNGLPHVKSFAAALGHDVSGKVNLTKVATRGQLVTVDVIQRTAKDKKRYNDVKFGGYHAPTDVTLYSYLDEKGSLIFQVVRYEPKAFAQRRPVQGGWRWDLQENVRRVPYHLPELVKTDRKTIAWVVEGEKDADNLSAEGLLSTTAPQGAGKWHTLDKEAVRAAFEGRDVVFLPDNDERGKIHVERAADDLRSVAERVRILNLPGLPPKGDVTDWLQNGGSAGDLGGIADRLAQVAAGARREITNYEEDEVDATGPGGGTKIVRYRMELVEVLKKINDACDDWPRKLGDALFYDHEGEVRIIDDESGLFAFFHRVADVKWVQGGTDAVGLNFVGRREVMRAILAGCVEVSDTTEVPLHPCPPEIYVTSRYQCAADASSDRFDELIHFFNPASEIDEALIHAFALTPFWGGAPGSRPLFVITGPEGVGIQETGKTQLASLLARPAGGTFAVHLPKGGSYADDVPKQVLSDVALHYRVVLLDNVGSKLLESSELAEILTCEQISGRPSHSRHRRRANYLTWCVTSVSPQLDEDLSSRSVVIHLAEPNRDARPYFKEQVIAFVAKHREEIIAGAVARLRRQKTSIISRYSRFPTWDNEVLGAHPLANEVLDSLKERRGAVDARGESLAVFLDELASNLAGTDGVEKVLKVKELAVCWNEANTAKVAGPWVSRKLREAQRAGKLPAWLHLKWTKRHGSPWVVDLPEMRADQEREEEVERPAQNDAKALKWLSGTTPYIRFRAKVSFSGTTASPWGRSVASYFPTLTCYVTRTYVAWGSMGSISEELAHKVNSEKLLVGLLGFTSLLPLLVLSGIYSKRLGRGSKVPRVVPLLPLLPRLRRLRTGG